MLLSFLFDNLPLNPILTCPSLSSHLWFAAVWAPCGTLSTLLLSVIIPLLTIWFLLITRLFSPASPRDPSTSLSFRASSLSTGVRSGVIYIFDHVSQPFSVLANITLFLFMVSKVANNSLGLTPLLWPLPPSLMTFTTSTPSIFNPSCIIWLAFSKSSAFLPSKSSSWLSEMLWKIRLLFLLSLSANSSSIFTAFFPWDSCCCHCVSAVCYTYCCIALDHVSIQFLHSFILPKYLPISSPLSVICYPFFSLSGSAWSWCHLNLHSDSALHCCNVTTDGSQLLQNQCKDFHYQCKAFHSPKRAWTTWGRWLHLGQPHLLHFSHSMTDTWLPVWQKSVKCIISITSVMTISCDDSGGQEKEKNRNNLYKLKQPSSR